MRRLKAGTVFALAAGVLVVLLLSVGSGAVTDQQLLPLDSAPASTQQGTLWSQGETAPPASPNASVAVASPAPLNAQEALLVDAQIYASNTGISLDEAIRRFRLQDVAGHLEAELSTKEAETFAGLWLEHTPEFRLVVRFTRNAEETIRPYMDKYEELAGIIEVLSAEVSLVDLQRAQAEAMSIARGLGIPVGSQINVFENRVELYVAERVRFDAALQRLQMQGVRLPDHVEVITVAQMGGPDAELVGELVLVDDCLRVNDSHGNSFLLVWPQGFSLSTDGESIQVVDSTGQPVAHIGDEVKVSGGEVPAEHAKYLAPSLAGDCPGPYWLVGEMMSE